MRKHTQEVTIIESKQDLLDVLATQDLCVGFQKWYLHDGEWKILYQLSSDVEYDSNTGFSDDDEWIADSVEEYCAGLDEALTEWLGRNLKQEGNRQGEAAEEEPKCVVTGDENGG